MSEGGTSPAATIDPTPSRRWILVGLAMGLAVIALRLPLWSLPGLGRDEAMYVLWAHHPQPAYAPLLQGWVSLLRGLDPDAAWIWRVPSMVCGVIALVLFDRWLVARGARPADRGLALALLAFSPWQTYAGSVLHPDDLQLVAIFGFAWAARTHRIGLALLAAALAPWTKPSGVLVTLVAVPWALLAAPADRRRWPRATLALAVALVPFVFLHEGLVDTLSSFGQVGERSSLLQRIALLVLGVVFLAGPGALIRIAWRPWRLTWSDPRRTSNPRPAPDLHHAPDQVLALGLLGAFLVAAVWAGQVKGNWLLPGLFLSWPVGIARTDRRNAHTTFPRAAAATAIVTSLLLSSALSLVFARPDLAREAERRWGERILPAYLTVAGAREAEVASATQWWHRPAEYRSFESWCAQSLPAERIEHVVSDDYGLAAQWAVQCPSSVPRLVLPFDDLVPRPVSIPAGALVLAVRCTVADLVGTEGWTGLDPLPHPITGAPVHRARTTAEILLDRTMTASEGRP